MAHVRRIRSGVSQNRQLTSLPWIVILTLYVRNAGNAMRGEGDPKKKLEKMTTYFKQFPSDIQLWKKNMTKILSSYHGYVIKRSAGGRTSLQYVPTKTSSRVKSLTRLKRIVNETLEDIGSRKSLQDRFTTKKYDSMSCSEEDDCKDMITVDWKKRLPSHQAKLRKDFEESLLELREILNKIKCHSFSLSTTNDDVTMDMTHTTVRVKKTPVSRIVSNLLERIIVDVREGPSFRLQRMGLGFNGSKKVKISFVNEDEQKREYEKIFAALENSDVPTILFESAMELSHSCIQVVRGTATTTTRVLSEMWRTATSSIEKLRRDVNDVSLDKSFDLLRILICSRLASCFAKRSVKQILKYENTDPCVLSATMESSRVMMTERDVANERDLFSEYKKTLARIKERRKDTVRMEMTERMDRLKRVAHERRLEATRAVVKSPPSPPGSREEGKQGH